MAGTATEVRRSLQTSRAAGVDFPDAWSTATRDLDASWSRALAATVASWRAAYHQEAPCPAERALQALRGRPAA